MSSLSKSREIPKKKIALSDIPEHLRVEYVEARERSAEWEYGLPHLYGWKWYTWAREFFESDSKMNFLCAANQISKSSTQIRKCIHWATEEELWPRLWAQKPNQFWYLYPTKDVATIEFHTKWKLFLPRGKMMDDPKYGWKPEFDKGKITAIHFLSGVSVYFKTYAQDTGHLQTGTVFSIFCDEELPLEHYDELIFRISATDGYFHMVFTATLGQDFWRQVMEPEEGEVSPLPEARKQTVSLYESMYFEDGTPSHWTEERIKIVENRCKDKNEVLKRVHGRFVIAREGLKYSQFDIKRHMKKYHPVPRDWLIWSAVDGGSGGKAHPAGILFLAVSPDYKKGRIFLAWRGDNVGDTTAGDVFDKYMQMKQEGRINPIEQIYDPGYKDFVVIAERKGESFTKANKDHEVGEEIVNVLFKNDMLHIYEGPELRKLATELSTLRKATLKKNAKDNLADPLRYLCVAVPWDWTAIGAELPSSAVAEEDEVDIEKMSPKEREAHSIKEQIEARRKEMDSEDEDEHHRIESEFQEANDAYGV